MDQLLAALLALNLSAMPPAPPPCNPAVGNWVNAAPTTCRITGNGSQAKLSRFREAAMPGCNFNSERECPTCGKDESQ